MSNGNALPTFISFYCGHPYYYLAAERLIQDCRDLGLDHDIVELEVDEGEEWPSICRRKIAFYKAMHDKHPAGVFWLDVDTRILRRPEFLSGGSYTFGAYLRGFRSFRQFDPDQVGRTFNPAFLHLPPNDGTRRFVEHLAALERGSEVNGTDDYFMQEAWSTFPETPSVHLFSPDTVAFAGRDDKPTTVFLVGESGNVRRFMGKVEQHTAKAYGLERQKRLLSKLADDAARKGRRGDAITLTRMLVGADRSDRANVLRLANLYLRDGERVKAEHLLKPVKADGDLDTRSRMMLGEIALELGDKRLLGSVLEQLESSGDPTVLAYVRSRRFRLELDRRAARKGLSDEQRPELWWMERPFPGDFGDVLNPYLVEKLTGAPPRFAPKGRGLLAIGSVIKFAKSGTRVWGTGTPRMTDKLAPDAIYTAVRGPFTRELVLQSGGSVPEVYGDPAMLLPLVYPRRGPPQKGRVGLIRHTAHKARPIRTRRVYEIDILRCGYDDIERFLDQVLSCEYILSTSLHGLIVAHAYGIPTRWCAYLDDPESINGGEFKFRDHYAAFDIPTEGPLDLSALEVVSSKLAAQCTEVVRKPFDAVALLDAAPFEVLPEIRRAAVASKAEAEAGPPHPAARSRRRRKGLGPSSEEGRHAEPKQRAPRKNARSRDEK